MPKEKTRLDELLVQTGLATDLTISRSYILSGSVTVQGKKITKSGTVVPNDSIIELSVQIAEDVSRGSTKLRGAFDVFFSNNPLPLFGQFVCDLGASTGGFTQVLLEKGAEGILAVDVGYGQIAGRLRNHPRVCVLDRFHAKDLSWTEIQTIPHIPLATDPEWGLKPPISGENPILWFVTDLSFISITSILPLWKRLSESRPYVSFHILHLVKPQFEVDAKYLDNGILRNLGKRREVLWKLARIIRTEYKGKVVGVADSPILGQKGNREYFLYWKT